jgi:hypothetical protein
MRPPRRLIEPNRVGVSMRTRGLRWSAASRGSTVGAPGMLGTVPGAGAEGPPAWLGEGTPGCCVWPVGAGGWAAWRCFSICGTP